MNEEWRPIKGLEGHYEVSNTGKVRGLRSGKVLSPFVSNCGYHMVGLCTGFKTRKGFLIHRLVAETFIPNPLCKSQVNHIDGDKGNNAVSNLEWTTPKENTYHAYKVGLRHTYGSGSPSAKLSEEDVREIKRLYSKGTKQYGYRSLAKKYGVSHKTIYSVIKNITWKGV